MPEKRTVERAKEDLRKGKRPTTAAGEFVREEMEHVKRGKHGVSSRKQAVAIGLSKARRAGVPLAPPKKGQAGRRTRRSAEAARRAGRKGPVAGAARGRKSSGSRGRKTAPRRRSGSSRRRSGR